jgi:5'-3' exoribonuclease 1
MKIPFDIGRIIDDFILVCFFVGNDFLPRVYCFDIKEGTIESLIDMFKDHLKNCENFVTNRGKINWVELKRLMNRLALFEIEATKKKEKTLNKSKNISI